MIIINYIDSYKNFIAWIKFFINILKSHSSILYTYITQFCSIRLFQFQFMWQPLVEDNKYSIDGKGLTSVAITDSVFLDIALLILSLTPLIKFGIIANKEKFDSLIIYGVGLLFNSHFVHLCAFIALQLMEFAYIIYYVNNDTNILCTTSRRYIHWYIIIHCK